MAATRGELVVVDPDAAQGAAEGGNARAAWSRRSAAEGEAEALAASRHAGESLDVYVILKPFRRFGEATLSRFLGHTGANGVRTVMKQVGICHYLIAFRPHGAEHAHKEFVVFDFGPLNRDVAFSHREAGLVRMRDVAAAAGGDRESALPSSSSKAVLGEVREKTLAANDLPHDAVCIGTTHLSVPEVRALSKRHPNWYELHANDCRHFVNRVARESTGVERASLRVGRFAVRGRWGKLGPWRLWTPFELGMLVTDYQNWPIVKRTTSCVALWAGAGAGAASLGLTRMAGLHLRLIPGLCAAAFAGTRKLPLPLPIGRRLKQAAPNKATAQIPGNQAEGDAHRAAIAAADAGASDPEVVGSSFDGAIGLGSHPLAASQGATQAHAKRQAPTRGPAATATHAMPSRTTASRTHAPASNGEAPAARRARQAARRLTTPLRGAAMAAKAGAAVVAGVLGHAGRNAVRALPLPMTLPIGVGREAASEAAVGNAIVKRHHAVAQALQSPKQSLRRAGGAAKVRSKGGEGERGRGAGSRGPLPLPLPLPALKLKKGSQKLGGRIMRLARPAYLLRSDK